MIACGALGAHLREITARRQWPVELHGHAHSLAFGLDVDPIVKRVLRIA